LSGEPNYRRIVRVLEGKIEAGEYPPGHRLPPERELCEIFGVSRITARQALSELARRRLVATRVVSTSLTTPDTGEATTLGCDVQDAVVRIVRLRFVDGDPYALETSTLLARRFPGLEAYDFGARSLYDVLARTYGTRLVRARETVAPVILAEPQAELLGVDIRQPALRLIRSTYDDHNVATEAASALIRGDRCQLLFELWADQRTAERA
jgi:GntR family transcriptional regulator